MELAFVRVLKMISKSAMRRDALERESQLHQMPVRKKSFSSGSQWKPGPP